MWRGRIHHPDNCHKTSEERKDKADTDTDKDKRDGDEMISRKISLRNTLVALLFALPAAFLLPRQHDLVPAVVAFVWALFFEYGYHRWFQHRPGTIFEQKHRQHHASYRRWDEVEHVNFGGHPIYVVLLFASNGALLLIVDAIFHVNFFPASMLVFVGYFILMEEIHYRIHADRWVPFGVGVKHHHRHHESPPKNFNVFLPLFDWFFRTLGRTK